MSEIDDGVGYASALRAEPVELADAYLDLDGIIARLEDENPDRVLPLGFARPHSYRGNYADLAFEPLANITIREMLAAAREALGSTYQGYKGGDYRMDGGSECWIANYGRSGDNKIGPLLLELLLAQPAPTAGGGQPNAFDLDPLAQKGDTE